MQLGVAIPKKTIRFVDVLLDADYDTHIILSNARNNMTTNASLKTSLAYLNAWYAYYRTYILYPGSCKTRKRIDFVWSIQMFAQERAVIYADGSPLFELLCVASATLAFAYNEKRSTIHFDDNDVALHAFVERIEKQWLPRFTPRLGVTFERPLVYTFDELQKQCGRSLMSRANRAREAFIYAPSYWRNIAHIINAHDCYAPYMRERLSDSKKTSFCSRLFAASECLRRADDNVYTSDSVLHETRTKLLSFAYQVLGEQLVESEHAALALVCISEAQELLNSLVDASNAQVCARKATLAELYKQYTQRNRTENFSATLPTRAQLKIVFAQVDNDQLCVAKDSESGVYTLSGLSLKYARESMRAKQ